MSFVVFYDFKLGIFPELIYGHIRREYGPGCTRYFCINILRGIKYASRLEQGLFRALKLQKKNNNNNNWASFGPVSHLPGFEILHQTIFGKKLVRSTCSKSIFCCLLFLSIFVYCFSGVERLTPCTTRNQRRISR